MIILIRLFLYGSIAFSLFFIFFGVKFLYFYTISNDSPLKYELLEGHVIGTLYAFIPALIAFGAGYYYKNVLHKLENRMSKVPLLILGSSYLYLFII